MYLLRDSNRLFVLKYVYYLIYDLHMIAFPHISICYFYLNITVRCTEILDFQHETQNVVRFH